VHGRGNQSGYYCPSSTVGLSASVLSASNVTITVTFSVASADSLISAGGGLVAFDDLAGTFTGSATGTFDWGLPFFLGATSTT
jgi:hypothetical protein